jgi:hypothetical protein
MSDAPLAGHIRLRLTVAYDGTAYSGWQLQPADVSVQLRLEEALAKLFPSAPRVHSSSRTDTGVHARGMSVHFDIPRAAFRMEPRKLVLEPRREYLRGLEPHGRDDRLRAERLGDRRDRPLGVQCLDGAGGAGLPGAGADA